jgi:hypothetical protein
MDRHQVNGLTLFARQMSAGPDVHPRRFTMSKSDDTAKDPKTKPLSDKELDKASGGRGPSPVGGPGTVPTPDERAKWEKPNG